MNRFEFYSSPTGEVVMEVDQKNTTTLKSSNRSFVRSFLSKVDRFYPKAYLALSTVFSSLESRKEREYKMVRRFIKCNFGEYSGTSYDVDSIGTFNFEKITCPLRGGDCRWEGVICMPKCVNPLSVAQIRVMQLWLVDDMTKEEIGKELFLSPVTVKNHIHDSYKKMQIPGSVHNKKQAALKWFLAHNLMIK